MEYGLAETSHQASSTRLMKPWCLPVWGRARPLTGEEVLCEIGIVFDCPDAQPKVGVA